MKLHGPVKVVTGEDKKVEAPKLPPVPEPTKTTVKRSVKKDSEE